MQRLHSNMKLLVYLLFPAVLGFNSTELYEYQIESLKPRWISLTDEDGSVNVTVDYDYYNSHLDIYCFWWVNGKLVTDGEDNIRVDNFFNWRRTPQHIYWHSDNPIDEDVRRASILLPSGHNVQSLQLQMVSHVFEVVIDINVLPLTPRKSVREYIPKYKLELTPKDEIAYVREDNLTFTIHFTADDLDRLTYEEVKAEFIGMDSCTTPCLLNITSSNRRGNFLHLRPATYDRDRVAMSWEYQTYLRKPSHKIRRLNINYGSANDLPRGVLKVTTGYRSRSPCRIFAGVKVTQSAFIKPPPYEHEQFFPENSVAFVDQRSNYYVQYGSSLDVSVTAVGGSLKSEDEWYDDRAPDNPQIVLRRRRQELSALAEFKRLFETEAIFRFRNVTDLHSGNYVVKAKVGSGKAMMTFNIYVQRDPAICRL